MTAKAVEKSVKATTKSSEQNTPEVKLRPRKKGMSTPSIRRALKGEFKDEKQISVKEQHAIYSREGELEAFTEDQLSEKWNAFLSTLDDRPNLKATLAIIPKLNEDFTLILEIDNRIQDELIAGIRPELVSFLRRELRNSKINLKTLITEVKREKVIYSDIERYKAMAEKNPDLAYLKQTLHLDF